MPLVVLHHLGLVPRLNPLSLSLEAGEMIGLLGPNGSGKSTLLHCLAGLLPYTGSLYLDAQDSHTMTPQQRARCIGFMPQFCQPAWALSVEDVVHLGRLPWGDHGAPATQRAMEQLDVLGLRKRAVRSLSGGEQARVWLARVLAGTPRLLLADEPIASLDLYHQRNVLQTLKTYAQQAHTVVLALHDFSLAARYCDRLCLMQQGQLRALGTPAQVLTAPLLEAVFQVPMRVDFSAHPPVITPQ